MLSRSQILKSSELETPFYFYDLSILQRTLEECRKYSDKYDFRVHYAFKANANDEVLALIRQYGFGADCVSGNEVRKAIETGFTRHDIVFAGVGKSDKEINYALDHDIFCF